MRLPDSHLTLVGTRLPLLSCTFFFFHIVGGDPLQLGPVMKGDTRPDAPVYMCRVFRDSFLSRYGSLVFLSGTHRQSRSSWFASCLDRIRTGEVTDEDLMVLNATSDGVSEQLWNTHTQLRALNKDVDAFNDRKLGSLPGPTVVYTSRDEVNSSITHPNRVAYIYSLLQDSAPAAVSLKAGAAVLCTREVEGIPTGTQGVVLECHERHVVCDFLGRRVPVECVSFDAVDNCNTHLGTRCALPLVLAWAMTIHRAQGTNLATLAIDFSRLSWCKEGLVYAGLSRCRLMEGLFVRGLCRKHIVVCRDALDFYSM